MGADEVGGVRLHVRGGVGGTSARLADLERAALLLRQVSGRLAEAGATAGRVALNPAVAATALAAPASYAAAEAAVGIALAGPSGAMPLAARVEGIGRALALAAESYAAADRAVAAGFRAAALTAGFAAGRTLATVAPAQVLALGGATVVAFAGGPGPGERGAVLPLNRLGGATISLLSLPGPLVQTAAAAAPGAVAGLLGGLPPLGPLWAAAAGGRWPPRSSADLAALAATGSRAGPWLRESGAARVAASAPAPVPPPHDLADVIRRIPVSPPGASSVRVDRVTGPDGRVAWVVAVPGTTSWNPVPGTVPLDLTSNVHLVAGGRSAATAAVAGAMAAAGVRPGEPVLLAGHSQGGMAAAALAADPEVRQRFRITHVVTAGSPVAGFPVPEDVAVLSLEHGDDVVPQLDGAANPDRPTWVTVTRDAVPADPPPIALAPDLAHRVDTYARTAAAADASPDPSLTAWRHTLTPFLARPGATATTTTVTAVRGPGP